MPTRCNRGFYCRSYCLLNMFRAPLCPSSGTQEYYTVVVACGISCCGFQVAGLVWSWGLCVRFAGCCSILQIWCNFDRALSLICGNKMPTRCNRGFYCRSYCLLNIFRATLCPSSGAQEYYTVVAACGILCCGFSSSWSGVKLRVMCPVCRMLQHPADRTHNPQLHTRPATWKPQHEIPQAATTV